MADISGASLGPIYERLNSAPSYHPLEADTFADWSLEAGDIVTVTRDNKGYQSPVHSSVVTWKKQPQVQISSTGNEQREAISKISQKKFRNGSSSLRANQALYWEMTSDDGLLHAVISATETELRTEYTEAIANTDTKLSTRITQNARSITLEAERASTAEGVLQGKITVEADRITNEVTRAVDEERTLRGALEVEADRVGMVVGYTDTRPIRYVYQTSMLPRPGDPSVIYYCQDSKKYYEWSTSTNSYHLTEPGKFIKAGEIVESINEAGETEAHIDADKVYIGNSKSTTIINGKLNVSDFTAESISARLATLAQVVVNGLNVIGDVYVRNGAGSQQNVSAAIWDIQLSGPVNNVYTLKRRRINEANYVDIGTFSRATTLSGAWSSGTYRVSASPQGNSLSTTLQILSPDGDVSKSGKSVKRAFKAYVGPDETHLSDTGFKQTISIDATSVYDDGYADGQSASAPSDIGIYDNVAHAVPSQTLELGGHVDLWGGCSYGGEMHWGDKVTITAPSNPYPSTMTLTYWKAEKDEDTWYYYWYGTKNDHPAAGKTKTFHY